MGKDVEAYWIRQDNWFLSWNDGSKEVLLFDVDKDPQNNENVASQNLETMRALTQKIKNWKAQKSVE